MSPAGIASSIAIVGALTFGATIMPREKPPIPPDTSAQTGKPEPKAAKLERAEREVQELLKQTKEIKETIRAKEPK